jgi:hypothetical protein
MTIVDLDKTYLDTYCHCLEDWSDEIKEAGSHKEQWVRHMTDKGLWVKLALEDGKAVGMIQYVPIEEAFAEGSGAYFIHCIWVHGYKQGVGNHQKKGIGIDGKQLRTGPPPGYAKIQKKIARSVKKRKG